MQKKLGTITTVRSTRTDFMDSATAVVAVTKKKTKGGRKISATLPNGYDFLELSYDGKKNIAEYKASNTGTMVFIEDSESSGDEKPAVDELIARFSKNLKINESESASNGREKPHSNDATEFMKDLYENLKNGLSIKEEYLHEFKRNGRNAGMLVTWQESHFQSYVCGTLQSLATSEKYKNFEIDWDTEYKVKYLQDRQAGYVDLLIFLKTETILIELKYVPISYLTLDVDASGPKIFKNFDFLKEDKAKMALDALTNVSNSINQLKTGPNLTSKYSRSYGLMTNTLADFLKEESAQKRFNVDPKMDDTYQGLKIESERFYVLNKKAMVPEKLNFKKELKEVLYLGSSDVILNWYHSYKKEAIYQILISALNQCIKYYRSDELHVSSNELTNNELTNKKIHCYSLVGVFRDVFLFGGRVY